MFTSMLNSQYSLDARNELYRTVRDSEWTLECLSPFKKLKVHTGCVNTIQWNNTGDLILSGSDDRKLALTRYLDGKILLENITRHKANIFSAKFLPQSGDVKVVSCSGDGVIIVTDIERDDASSQDVFNCHSGTVYNVVTSETEPHGFSSVGDDGTVRWFDLRVKSSCVTSNCKNGVVFTYQSALTSLAINPMLPYELAVGSSDSHVYVMDRRNLGASNSSTIANSVVSKMIVPDLTKRPCQITSVEFSPEGDQLLASFSGDAVYLFSVKDPHSFSCLSNSELESEFSEVFYADCENGSATKRKPRLWQNFKRIRLRGDWSDTGPSAGTERLATSHSSIGQARPRIQESLMHRMADVLTSMLNRSSQPVTSPISPVGSPVLEPNFPSSLNHNSTMNDNNAQAESTEVIDCVTYESLGTSVIQQESNEQPVEEQLAEVIPENANSEQMKPTFIESNNREARYTLREHRPEPEPGCSGLGCSSRGDYLNGDTSDDDFHMDDLVDGVIPTKGKIIYRPAVRVKYSGHRNARTIINEATFWGKNYIMSGSDCGHVFIWNRSTGKVFRVLQADSHVVNRVRPHPFEPILATAGIDYDVKLWMPFPSHQTNFKNIDVHELMLRNARMLEETRDTITVPATFMIRMLSSLSQLRRAGNRSNSDDPIGTPRRDSNV